MIMKLSYLKLKNIGPFKEQTVSFEKDDGTICPVVIITGENGTGKSIVIDSIRTVFRGLYGIERDIVADTGDFLIELGLIDNQTKYVCKFLRYNFLPVNTILPPFSMAHIYGPRYVPKRGRCSVQYALYSSK